MDGLTTHQKKGRQDAELPLLHQTLLQHAVLKNKRNRQQQLLLKLALARPTTYLTPPIKTIQIPHTKVYPKTATELPAKRVRSKKVQKLQVLLLHLAVHALQLHPLREVVYLPLSKLPFHPPECSKRLPNRLYLTRSTLAIKAAVLPL